MNVQTPSPKMDLKTILTDVRHSWRIVAAFQQRMFFLLRQIEAGFPELEQSYWEPVFNSRPPQGRTKPGVKNWSWDFLPCYVTDNWFTLVGTTTQTELKPGDWFMTVRIISDTGFDDEVEQSASFSGPDPQKMEPVEQTDTSIYFAVYEITGEAGAGLKPGAVWGADAEENGKNFVWEDLPGVGARRMFAGGSLVDYLAEGAMEELIADVRRRLIDDGFPLQKSDKAD